MASSNWLSIPVNAAKSVWTVVSSTGPFFISQSETASKAWAEHQGRLADVEVKKGAKSAMVEVGKELLLQEGLALGEIKKKLLADLVTAPPEDRLRMRRDLEELGASERQLNVGALALQHLSNASEEQPAGGPEPEVSLHWMDKFRDLARNHNEPWREDLLSRALAAESAAPGTVSPRVLWLIGTLEEKAFKAFACLLDLSSVVSKHLIIPARQVYRDKIPDCELGDNIDIGMLLYYIKDSGLLGDAMSQTHNEANKQFVARYGDLHYAITGSVDTYTGGILPSYLGNQLAKFCQPRFNSFGLRIFNEWLQGLDKSLYVIKKVIPVGGDVYKVVNPG